MTFLRGTCPLETCQAEGITPRHYSSKHGIRLKDHFKNVKSSKGYRKYCINHPKIRANGPHKAMGHLVKKHPELFSQESQDTTLEVSENEREIDPEAAFANAVVGGVYEFLVERRQEAEAETERLEVEMGDLAEKLRIATESNARLELSVAELTGIKLELEEKNLKLSEESSRILGEARKMNDDMLRVRNGAKSATEFRETYGEMQGRRG